MQQPHATLLSALQEAKEKGFIDDFQIDEKGHVMSFSEEIPHPQIIEIIPCLSCGATLYLITGDDRQGTYIHHWDI